MGLRIFLVCALLLGATGTQAALLADRHMQRTNQDCAMCHEEKPAAQSPKEEKCKGCHGSLEQIGSKPLPKGKINPHLNHVEELYCSDCHQGHKQSKNYCLQCHDDAFLGMQVP